MEPQEGGGRVIEAEGGKGLLNVKYVEYLLIYGNLAYNEVFIDPYLI